MIRPFRKSDLSEIMQIWLSSNIEVHNFVDESYWKDNFEFVQKIIPQTTVLVYEKQNSIAGFIGLTNGYINGLFVKKIFRSKGIGKSLIEYAKLYNKHLTLDVYALNQSAVNFYKRESFCITDQHIDKDTKALEYTMEFHQ
jgi:putative acetyltransferase